jgi:PqqD family protein of HPr-rel-A system
MGECWVAVQDPALRSRTWDGETVVYDDRSGDTHYLDLVTAEAWRSVCSGAREDDEIVGTLADYLGVEADDRFRERVKAMLTDLVRRGLLERASA